MNCNLCSSITGTFYHVYISATGQLVTRNHIGIKHTPSVYKWDFVLFLNASIILISNANLVFIMIPDTWISVGRLNLLIFHQKMLMTMTY